VHGRLALGYLGDIFISDFMKTSDQRLGNIQTPKQVKQHGQDQNILRSFEQYCSKENKLVWQAGRSAYSFPQSRKRITATNRQLRAIPTLSG
jgi:hypothetical protein